MGTISDCIKGIIIDREERKLKLRMVQEAKGKGHGKQVKKKKAPRSRWFTVTIGSSLSFSVLKMEITPTYHQQVGW